MIGSEMKRIRHQLGLSTVELGRAFGYQGQDNTISVTIRKYESGSRPIPPWLGRLLRMFEMHGVPDGWASKLPPSTPTDGSAETPDIYDEMVASKKAKEKNK